MNQRTSPKSHRLDRNGNKNEQRRPRPQHSSPRNHELSHNDKNRKQWSDLRDHRLDHINKVSKKTCLGPSIQTCPDIQKLSTSREDTEAGGHSSQQGSLVPWNHADCNQCSEAVHFTEVSEDDILEMP